MSRNELPSFGLNRKTFVEIDLNAIVQNLTLIKQLVGNDKKLLIAVKADGYGHGAIQVSKLVEEKGLADFLGVATPLEGIELREAGLKLPILILGLILNHKEVIKTLLDYNLAQTVSDFHLASEISKGAKVMKKTAKLHLKIDTGMGRIGCQPEESLAIIKKVSFLDYIELEGLFSHFPLSDDPSSDFTVEQIRVFRNIIKELELMNINIPLKHLANSGAILNFSDSIFNMIRPGIIAYGYMPSKDCKRVIDIIPSMTFKSCIIFLKRVKMGTPLSYGHIYKTEKDSNIATIPVGYGDGYNRLLSNRGKVIIRNKIYPVVGRVCMDQILVNLGDDEYSLGEEVILFGKKEITVETIANWIDTIPYEVTCAISKRVCRSYN